MKFKVIEIKQAISINQIEDAISRSHLFFFAILACRPHHQLNEKTIIELTDKENNYSLQP